MQAIDPRNFKDGGDVGTLVVRYVVKPQGDKNTVLRIDALFKEDFRRTIHQSNGSVENAEYKDIREHLDSIEVMKAQNAEALKERQERLAKKKNVAMRNGGESSSSARQVPAQAVPAKPVAESPAESSANTATQAGVVGSTETAAASGSETPGAGAGASPQTLEQRVKDLRRQAERLVKPPGAALKSAPFHTAGTLVLLTSGTEVLIQISTPYWYGVETHEGQHGWMERDQLELLP
jgi:hypothetical protein